jgi:hypothetical protein
MTHSTTITFTCPNGHRISVPTGLAGKTGTCSKCGVRVTIPAEPQQTDEPPGSAIVSDLSGTAISSADLLGDAVEPTSPLAAALEPATGTAAESPTARLIARLWQERAHGGEVELHLSGSSRPILPQFFERDWSQGSHALFARQEPDGTITLEAVAWESIQRVVVRKVQGLPDGMFLDEGES